MHTNRKYRHEQLPVRGASVATWRGKLISAFPKVLVFLLPSHRLYFVPRFLLSRAHPVPLPVMTPGLLLFTTIFIVLYINLIINVITIIMPFVVNGRFLSSLLVMVWLYYVPLVKRMLNPHELQCKNDPSTRRVSEKLAQ